jgi:phosphatidylinositol-3-phosphatase
MNRISRLWRQPLARAVVIVTLLVTLLGMGVFAFAHSVPASASGHDENRQFKHVFTIMMENTGIEALLSNPNAPWINQAILTNGVAGNYYGVTHPSQPNYIAATSGALNGVTDDNDHTVDVPNIVDQLESHGKTWKAYMQSLSLCVTKLDHACGNQLYERKHNPFVSYLDVQSNAARMANIVDSSQLGTDLANNTVPNYVWISPDQCNDMHGRFDPDPAKADVCGFDHVQELIAAGDTFLSNTVGQIMASRAWKDNSVILIAWDESDFTGTGFNGFGDDRGCCNSVAGQGGGHVLTLVITREGGARSSFTPYNHYSLLRTTEDALRLGCLANACDTANVKPMSDLVSTGD